MIRYIAIIYLLLYVCLALHFSSRPDPQEGGPYTFPSLTTNYLRGAP